MMKKLTILMLCAALLLSLCACGGKVPSKATVEELAAAIDGTLAEKDKMVAVDESYIKGAMGLDLASVDSFIVKINGYGVNVDEYGVFKCADEEQAAATAKAVQDYLAMRDETWMPEYMPEERPKVQNAKSTALGCYVMYSILSDEGATAAGEAFEACVKKG